MCLAYDYLAAKGASIKVADPEKSYQTGLQQFLDQNLTGRSLNLSSSVRLFLTRARDSNDRVPRSSRSQQSSVPGRGRAAGNRRQTGLKTIAAWQRKASGS